MMKYLKAFIEQQHLADETDKTSISPFNVSTDVTDETADDSLTEPTKQPVSTVLSGTSPRVFADKPVLTVSSAQGVPVFGREWKGVPDSRNPLISPTIRAKIEAIEAEARRLGWPPELLYNNLFWSFPRGLAAVLDADDEITAVTPEVIDILRHKRDVLRFRREPR
jgi:hypothetical protein